MNAKLVFRIFTILLILAVFVGTGALGLAGAFSTGQVTSLSGPYIPTDAKSKNPGMDMTAGYTEAMGMRETLADFEHGVDGPYDRIYYTAPHYWGKLEPVYTYTPVTAGDHYLTIGATTQEGADNSNYWYVLPDQNGNKDGSCSVEYKLTSPRESNHENLAPYQQLRILWKGTNPDSKKVNINISLYNPLLKQWFDLGSYEGKSKKLTELILDLRLISQENRANISKIKFTTKNSDIGKKDDGQSYQRNDLYYIDIYSDTTVKKQIQLDDITMETEYLGNMAANRLGAYSASGFYDPQDKKWKVWFGCGIPESIASDNVYYMETTDPQKGWSKQYRVVLEDPNHILHPATSSPGYGGDPSVIKVNGTYYMYISGLISTVKTGHYNQIFLATSKDGKTFQLHDKAVVVAKNGGSLGYGTGAPSVVYKDGTFYLYYYSQYEPEGGYFLRTSKDGITFSEATRVGPMGGDVKWMPTLNKWVMTYYTEQNQTTYPQAAAARVAFSDDGIAWEFGMHDDEMPAQDYSAAINHNPGWIGTPEGFGTETMFLTFGNNDLALQQHSSQGAGMQMDTRQLEWTRISFKTQK